MRDDLSGSIRAQNEAWESELRSLDERLEELRHDYDRYFMGLEKIPPERKRTTLERDMRNAEVRKAHKTAVKFRYTTIRNRLTTYRRHWDRIMRMIEEGRFRRDKTAKSQLGAMRPRGTAPQAAANSGDSMRQLYDDWMQARRDVGQSASVDYDKFRARIEKQRTQHQARFGVDDIDYAVRVKDGKVAMVARPKGR